MRRDASTSVLEPVTGEPVELPSDRGTGPPARQGPPFRDDPRPPAPAPWDGPAVSNARLGMLIFLAFEAMLFAGLIGTFVVFRFGSALWPPAGQPRLPLLITWVNTGILLLSGYTMHAALRALRLGNRPGVAGGLTHTALLGSLFLFVQGSEWVRLIRHGLTLSAGIYGATFYTVIGCHGLHVLGAVLWLLVARLWVARQPPPGRRAVAIELCGMYWYFVVGLWPVLFTLVYLS